MQDFFGDEIEVDDFIIRSYKTTTDLTLSKVIAVYKNKVDLVTMNGRREFGLTESIKLIKVPIEKVIQYKLER